MKLKNKVTIIGAGFVGSTTAFSLISHDICEEIALIDTNKKLCESQVMDLEHSTPFYGSTRIKAGDYNDCRDSKVAIITCGAAQKPGETRLDLVKKNSKIIASIVPNIFKANPSIVLIMVTNPVDILTYQAIKMYPTKKNQIIGSGTILDTARFRQLLGEELNISPKSIHAYIIGEHGDTELPLWSTAQIGNTKIKDLRKFSEKKKTEIFNKARNAAYTIIDGKQATYYAIGAGVALLTRTILNNNNAIYSISHLMSGEYGLKDVCLSMPAVIGAEGISQKIKMNISYREKLLLKKSSKALKKVIKTI